jgi:hypothetical protein
MSAAWIAFMAGMVLGTSVGVFTMALIVSGKRRGDR